MGVVEVVGLGQALVDITVEVSSPMLQEMGVEEGEAVRGEEETSRRLAEVGAPLVSPSR